MNQCRLVKNIQPYPWPPEKSGQALKGKYIAHSG